MKREGMQAKVERRVVRRRMELMFGRRGLMSWASWGEGLVLFFFSIWDLKYSLG